MCIRDSEYGAYIIHSLETGQPRVVYGNVANDHLIDNLPQGCLLYTSDAADERSSVDLGGRRIIKKKNK